MLTKSESFQHEIMREICVMFLFVLIAAFAVNAAHLKASDDELNQIEMEFMKNFTSIVMSESEGRGKTNKKAIKEMLKKPQIPPITTDPVPAVTSRIPCECKNGICSCCVGGFFFNNKGCMKIRYIPEDFSFELRMLFNGNTLYKNTMSGKNPRPICISPPRFGNWMEMCARFHDIYFVGRNMHICLDVTASLGDFDLLDRQFDCMKFGNDGVALVAQEEGGGHPGYPPVINSGTDAEIDAGGVDEIEDYDEIVG